DFWQLALAAPNLWRCRRMAGLRSPSTAGHAGQRTDRGRGPVGARASPLRGLGRCNGCWAAAPILPLVHRCCVLRLAPSPPLPLSTPPPAFFQTVLGPAPG